MEFKILLLEIQSTSLTHVLRTFLTTPTIVQLPSSATPFPLIYKLPYPIIWPE